MPSHLLWILIGLIEASFGGDIKSHPLFPKAVAPATNQSKVSAADGLYFHGLNCDFVESADLNAKIIHEITALPISNCHTTKNEDQNGLFYCVGTIHCKGNNEILEHLDFYVDPVGCTTTDPTTCPNAKRCALDGGVFRIFETNIENSNIQETLETMKPLPVQPKKEEKKP